jgi:uncharacterized protein (DUF1330 family)
MVMLEFPSVDQAKAWYYSPEYEPLKKMRLASARGAGVLIEGLPAAA